MSTMSHNANMISVRATPELEEKAAKAAGIVGLKVSDFVRIGLSRLSDEVIRTGQLHLTRPATIKPRAIKKKARAAA